MTFISKLLPLSGNSKQRRKIKRFITRHAEKINTLESQRSELLELTGDALDCLKGSISEAEFLRKYVLSESDFIKKQGLKV